MERSSLRQRMGMKYADLDPILRELELNGRIKRSREMISLAISEDIVSHC
jgi:hypothetical protein